MYRIYYVILVMLTMVWLGGCSGRGGIGATAHTSAARHKATMRTYRVHGHTYRPTYVRVHDTMRGISSWYGPNFHGKYTSNGERYNMYHMTAAHKTWPMDTIVKVQNLDNGKSAIVRINDRGPFVRGRIIDCSYAAGKKLGLDKMGLAHVKLTVLGFAGKIYKPTKPTHTTSQETTAVREDLPKVHLTDFGVQVGAFRRYEGALVYRDRYQKLLYGDLRVLVRKFDEEDGVLYRVWVMGFGSEDEAREYIETNGIIGGFLIRP